MTTYVVDATNPTEPNDDRPASYLGLEMRMLKQHLIDIVSAQGNNNTTTANAIAAINTIFNSANGKTGLPVTGLLDVVLSIHKEVFGYTEGQTIHPSIDSKLTTLANNVNNVLTANYQNLLSITQQQTLDINTLKQQTASMQNTLNSVAANAGKLPIGYIIMTTNANNPASYLGYGGWTARCQGRHVAGVGNDLANGGHNFGIGKRGLRYWHLAVDQLPVHRHLSEAIIRSQTLNGVDYATNYSGSSTATWEHHKDYGAGAQKVPFTSWEGGNGEIGYELDVEAYYFWERTS